MFTLRRWWRGIWYCACRSLGLYHLRMLCMGIHIACRGAGSSHCRMLMSGGSCLLHTHSLYASRVYMLLLLWNIWVVWMCNHSDRSMRWSLSWSWSLQGRRVWINARASTASVASRSHRNRCGRWSWWITHYLLLEHLWRLSGQWLSHSWIHAAIVWTSMRTLLRYSSIWSLLIYSLLWW